MLAAHNIALGHRCPALRPRTHIRRIVSAYDSTPSGSCPNRGRTGREPTTKPGAASGLPCSELGLRPRRLRQLLLALVLPRRRRVLDLGVDLSAEEQEEAAQVHPGEQDDDGADRTVGLVVLAEVIHVET